MSSATGFPEAAERAAQFVGGELTTMHYKYLVEFSLQVDLMAHENARAGAKFRALGPTSILVSGRDRGFRRARPVPSPHS